MDKRLAITMTAILRPEVIRLTLTSFYDKAFRQLIGNGWRIALMVNVDPVGKRENEMPLNVAKTVTEDEIRASAGEGVEVFVRHADSPHFSTAFKKVWTMAANPWPTMPDQASAPWVFHLEDDWLLREPIDIENMVEVMESQPDIASLRLSWFKSETDRLKNWNRFFPWNGLFFECPREMVKDLGFCGHPGLLRGSYVRQAVELVDTKWNPEKQFHYWNGKLVHFARHWRYGVWQEQNSPPILREIGREWMAVNGYSKKGIKAFFNEYEDDYAKGL